MQKREIAWIVALLLVIGAYIHYFSHWGEKREIQVLVTARPMARRGANASALRVIFTLDTYYRLTSIKVTEVDSQHTNAVEHILWNLVSKSGSAPVKLIQYPVNVQGMEPELKGVQPEPLVPGQKYRMEVTAGALKGASQPFTVPVLPK